MSSEVPRTLCKNINTVAMLTLDALLRHFRKGMYHGGDRQLHTFISYVVLVVRNTVISGALVLIAHAEYNH